MAGSVDARFPIRVPSSIDDGPLECALRSDSFKNSPALTTQVLRNRIEEVLDSIRPALHMDGGDVELMDFREADGVVEVRLTGTCQSCPISMMTLKEGIESRLRTRIPEVTEVVSV